ncbi:hypothetical protein EBO15_13765 [Actinomadura harenae]|uniref:Uncharacterized protein n=1 Tax=Actinomadura harenae TaxID=2483351 RepID=A0A3M2M436_9ACTN|nr:hypothetical protein EBO15_13765 [Actinomadura harenae]
MAAVPVRETDAAASAPAAPAITSLRIWRPPCSGGWDLRKAVHGRSPVGHFCVAIERIFRHCTADR